MSRFTNPVPQFLDDAGKPIVNGTLTFYENGTTTDKDTFADVNLTILNENPVLLGGAGRTPNIFYNGTARVILTNLETGQEWDVPSVGDSGSGQAFDQWNSITEYATGALVEASDGEYHRSLQNNNTGNDPTTSPSFWENVRFYSIYNENVTYPINGLAQGSDGLLYVSSIAGNLGNDPTTSPSQWGGSSGAGNPFDQNLNTTDDVDFNSVTLPGGVVKIPDQDLDTTDDVDFNSITLPAGSVEVFDQSLNTTDDVDFVTVTATGDITANNFTPTGDTSASMGSTGAEYGHHSTGGAVIQGFGSVYDVVLRNRSHATALGVRGNTINLFAAGDLEVVGNIDVGDWQLDGSATGVEVQPGGFVGISRTVTSQVNMMIFSNGNGNVGRIDTNGSLTNYITSSDPRLKSTFEPFVASEAWAAFDGIYSAAGKFHFLSDEDKEVWGFNAHKLIDLGIGLGSEGEGPRDEELGGDVTPAGVDPAKIVPYLLAVIKDLNDRLTALED